MWIATIKTMPCHHLKSSIISSISISTTGRRHIDATFVLCPTMIRMMTYVENNVAREQ